MAPARAAPGHFRVLYFAAASTYTKKASDEFKAPLPVRDLFQFLDTQYPGIRDRVLSSCAVTVNLEYVDIGEDKDAGPQASEDVIIREGDEVAIIPPVSSG